VADEQFSKFVEVIKKLYVNILLLDAMKVPTYAKYIKDILGNKRSLPTTKVMQLTEECSIAILDPLSEKKKDPGCTTINVQSELNTLNMLFVIWEQASASCRGTL
jgi:hypothetical protein